MPHESQQDDGAGTETRPPHSGQDPPASAREGSTHTLSSGRQSLVQFSYWEKKRGGAVTHWNVSPA